MTHPAPMHLTWIATLFIALLGLASVIPVSESLELRLAKEQHLLTAQKSRLELQIRQWTEDARTAKELSQTLSTADVERLLAPADRSAMTAQLEPLAAAARLGNMTYTLTPAQPWDGGDNFPGIKDVTTSDLTIEAVAPDDGDVFTFLASLSTPSGRLELTDLDLTRLHDKQDAAPAVLNLRMKASFKWFANASEKVE